jgi:hypothetical protein
MSILPRLQDWQIQNMCPAYGDQIRLKMGFESMPNICQQNKEVLFSLEIDNVKRKILICFYRIMLKF